MREAMGSNGVTICTQIDERLRRQGELGEERRARKRVSTGTEMNESFLRLRDEDGDLLPGLPNHITLDQIVTKLPWTAFHLLSSVGHRWLQAIRSHEVHDARIHFQSTDTLVVMICVDNNFFTLYSITDQHFYKLPCFPRVHDRVRIQVPFFCVSTHGKIYVLREGNREVCVLDLVEQREWRQCARRKYRRHNFGYGAKDGKIYVFGGGDNRRKPVRGCEVYDPEKDSWSQIAPMEFWRHSPEVASFGEELFVHGGLFSRPGAGANQLFSRPSVLDAYHPIKNEWRRVGEHPSGQVFMALGKFHVMNVNTIHVYDHEKNTWSHLHSINLGGVAFYNPDSLHFNIVAIDDELLVAVIDRRTYHCFRGKGLGGKDTEILFQKKACRVKEESFFLCTIQL